MYVLMHSKDMTLLCDSNEAVLTVGTSLQTFSTPCVLSILVSVCVPKFMLVSVYYKALINK